MHIIHDTLFLYTKFLCLLHRINIGPDKDKLPTMFFLLPFYHFLYLLIGILSAGVFHSVRGDDK